MDSDKLNDLLKKYWACETTLEEEQQLKKFFRSEQVPAQWKETAALFRYFDEQRSRELRAGDEQTLIKKLKPVKKQTTVIRNLVRNTLRIAAGVAVLVAAIFLVRQELRQDTTVAVEDTYDDPHKAFEETKKALLMISKGFGSAEEQAKKIQVFNEAQEKVQASTDSDL